MKTFIQYKGTDICMDFYCECGHHNHYDGYFAYYIKCGNCGEVFKLSEEIKVTKAGKENLNNALKPIEE